MAPPCSSFSSAVTPAVRTCRFPKGLPWLKGEMRKRVAEGNELAAWCLKLLELCERSKVGWWLEQPDTSWMWRLPGFKRFRPPSSTSTWRVDFCYFGTPWRKRTKIACSNELSGRRLFCRCLVPHVLLRGRCPYSGVARTAVAQPYPKAFAAALARGIAREAGWCDSRRSLDIAGCARCSQFRIGEASHPGPRRARRPREGDLEFKPVQSAATLYYEAKLWEDFVRWCSSRLSDCLLVFSLCPVLAAMALRAYGNFCYGAGKTLSGFRRTIIAAQRRLLGCKPFLQLAWEMVSRWEALEPPVHRCPVPEPLVKAMVFLANAWGMERWAAIALLSFYGLARVGEVLRCKRSDLLFPADLLDKDVQHTKITDSRGAVQRYRAGMSPTDLQWLMTFGLPPCAATAVARQLLFPVHLSLPQQRWKKKQFFSCLVCSLRVYDGGRHLLLPTQPVVAGSAKSDAISGGQADYMFCMYSAND
ncbi:unnamed protein product [Symbiodinium sp. CCMP2456]|nr:unnamed protein product [Symbiodinium sp. CCMP2456]